MNASSLGLKSVSSTVDFEAQKGEKFGAITYNGMSGGVYSAGKTELSNRAIAINTLKGKISARYTSKNYVQQANGKWKSLDSDQEFSTVSKVLSFDRANAKAKMSAALVQNFATYITKSAVTASAALSSYTKTGNV